MALSPIIRRTFDEPDRAEAQARIIAEVQADQERFITAYRAIPESFGGRYVSADLFKETFPIYAAGIEARGRYNAPAHNPAAALSAEQFQRTLSGPGSQGIFLTGVPGSGKTTTVLSGGRLAADVRFVFEGQLSRPGPGMEKIAAAIEAGVAPTITAVLARPEDALRNTFGRFETIGRGAGVALMADIAGELPNGLETIRARFGDAVKLQVIDMRDRSDARTYNGWSAIEILREEGNREQIEERLRRELDRARRANVIGPDTFAQAIGQAPFAGYRGVDAARLGRDAPDGDGPGVSPGNPEQGFVAAEAGALLATAEAVDREAEAIGTADQRWSQAVDTAIESKLDQTDRLVDRLESLIEAQEARVNQAQAAQPGLLAMPGQRARAQRQLADAQQTMATLTARLERVREIRNEPDPGHPRSIPALARNQVKNDAPELFEEWTASRVARTLREQEERKAKRAIGEGEDQPTGQRLSQRQAPPR